MLERPAAGWWSSTPERMSTPVGCPLVQLKRSPFTPVTVAAAVRRRCIEVTVSRPEIASFESTGFSE